MNIIQQREKIMFLIDHVQSPRFPQSSYEQSIITSVDQYINDRYDNVKNQKSYSFESIQKIRDELYTIIGETPYLPVIANNLAYTNVIDDYRHLLLNKVRTIVGGTKEFVSIPTSYDEYKSEITIDPFTKPKTTSPYNIYHLENATGIEFFTEPSDSIVDAQLIYLKYSQDVSLGTELTADTVFAVPTNIIVSQPNSIINGVARNIGYEDTILGPITIVGGVVINFVNCDLPPIAHEEICKLSAKLLMGTVDDWNKSKFMEKESNIS